MSVSFESESTPCRSREVKTKYATPCSRAASIKAFPCTSSASLLAPGPSAGIETQKTPLIGLATALKIAGQSFKLPWTNLICSGDLSASRLADADSVLRVRAKMMISEELGAESKAWITAPPCVPVAPVMRKVVVVSAAMVDGALRSHVECLYQTMSEDLSALRLGRLDNQLTVTINAS